MLPFPFVFALAYHAPSTWSRPTSPVPPGSLSSLVHRAPRAAITCRRAAAQEAHLHSLLLWTSSQALEQLRTPFFLRPIASVGSTATFESHFPSNITARDTLLAGCSCFSAFSPHFCISWASEQLGGRFFLPSLAWDRYYVLLMRVAA